MSRIGVASLRWLAWGLASAVVYVAVVTLVAGSLPARLLYDGLLPPPPYHWVNPSAHPASNNEPAEAGAGVLLLGAQGSEAEEIGTDDGQALVTFPNGAVAPQRGESSVKVRITPLDPATVAPAPRGHPFDGNAYRVEASYAVSGKPAVLATSLTVVLRFPVQATEILRFLGPEWAILRTTTGYHQVLANTDRLGVFVAAAAPAESNPFAHHPMGILLCRGSWSHLDDREGRPRTRARLALATHVRGMYRGGYSSRGRRRY